MKNFKRISSVVLAIVMVFAMMVPAMAVQGTDGTITVNNANAGETYTIYKLFDVEYVDKGDGDIKDDPHSYTIKTDNPLYALLDAYTQDGEDVFTFIASAADATKCLVSVNEDVEVDAAALAAYLQDNVTVGMETASVVADSETVEFTGLEEGYYFVDTTVGTLCIIDTTNADVEINDKNVDPTIEKTVAEDTLGGYGKESYAAVGDTVEFKIEVTAQKGAENYKVTDILSDGLTYDDDSLAVYVDANGDGDYTPEEEVAADLYTLNTNAQGFTLTFDQEYLDTIDKATVITILYTATLNEKAINTDDNTNTATLTYGDNSSVESKTTTDSFELDLTKVDPEGNELTGAKFNLWSNEVDNYQIYLVELSEAEVTAAGDTYDADTNYYRIAMADEADEDTSAVIEAGKVKIYGLDGNADYRLEEIEAPEGYNILSALFPFTTTDELTDVASDVVVEVENDTGVELPETGGIGTTIFYLVGGLMVTGAFVLLMTKKRMGNRA